MSNPDWWLDPPEEPRCPPCPECDEEMWRCDERAFAGMVYYECRNPECAECATRYKKTEAEEE